MSAIEAHVAILQNKLKNFFQSNKILCGSKQTDEIARKRLKVIYTFLIKEECQQSKDYDSWKKRLRNGMDKIEDEIESYLYNVETQRQSKIKKVGWHLRFYIEDALNKIRIQRAMQDFLKITEGLSKDQYLVDSQPGDDVDDGQTPTICNWSEVFRSTDLIGTSKEQRQQPSEVKTQTAEDRTSHTTQDQVRTREADDRTSSTTQYQDGKPEAKDITSHTSQDKDGKPEAEDITSHTTQDKDGKPEAEDVTSHTIQDKGKEDLKKQLSSGESNVSVVWGPDGVGKTAITRAVTNLTGIKGRFQCQVWVRMYKAMNYRELLLRILNQVSQWVPINPEDMAEQDLAQLVFQQLVTKSILIVLEDAEDFQIIFKFFFGCIDSTSGSHVIITTNSKEAEYLVDELIRLEPLDEPKSLLLFNKTKILEKPGLTVDDKTAIRASMYKSCGGLPLKISLLEKLLSHSKVQNWPLFVEKQKKGIELDVYTLCYNKLPPHLKPCFLYLCLFPKSFPILIRRILRLWTAEELIIHHKDGQPGTQVEDIAESYLLEMVDRNLVEVVRWKSDGSPHSVHMNSNLYDAFLPVAASTGLVDVYGLKKKKKNEEQEEEKKEDIDYVRWYVEPEYGGGVVEQKRSSPDLEIPSSLLSNNVKLPSSSEGGCPRSFVSFRKRKGILSNDVGRFVKMLTSKRNFRLLRVLDLEDVYKPYLGNSLQNLLLLRYLGLRSTGLDSLPKDVGALPYLETLDIKHTNINKLPNSIWKMSRIRHLDLNGFHFDETQLMLFSSAAFISSLTTLTGFHVACRIHDRIFESLSRLTNLTKLGVYFHNPQDREVTQIAEWIHKLTALRSLKLGVTGRTTTTTTTRNDDPKTPTTPSPPTPSPPTPPQGRVLLLPDLLGHRNLIRIYLLGKLQKVDVAEKLPPLVKVLTLSMSNLEHDPMRSLGAPSKFLYLIELRLFADCYNKDKKMTCPPDSFPNLKLLKLWKLTSLEEIDPQDGSLKSLEHLEIRYCPNLTKIYELAKKLQAQTKLKELIMFSDPPRKELAKKIEKELKLCAREHNSSSPEEATTKYVGQT